VNCPLCTDQMLQPRYHSGIEIDVCPQCRGIWLDRGEIDRLGEGNQPPPPATRTSVPQPLEPGRSRDHRESDRDADDRVRDDHKPKGKKKKRKKSLAERLGDVLEEVIDL
jgi:uncharacterized protein